MQIESLLDESTAELAKMEFTPLLSTIEANFKLKKAVPLHTTLRIDCKVVITPPPPSPLYFHVSCSICWTLPSPRLCKSGHTLAPRFGTAILLSSKAVLPLVLTWHTSWKHVQASLHINNCIMNA